VYFPTLLTQEEVLKVDGFIRSLIAVRTDPLDAPDLKSAAAPELSLNQDDLDINSSAAFESQSGAALELPACSLAIATSPIEFNLATPISTPRTSCEVMDQEKMNIIDDFFYQFVDVEASQSASGDSAPVAVRFCSAPTFSCAVNDSEVWAEPSTFCNLIQWAPGSGSVFNCDSMRSELQAEAVSVLQRFFRQRFHLRSKAINDQIDVVIHHLGDLPSQYKAQYDADLLAKAMAKVPPFPGGTQSKNFEKFDEDELFAESLNSFELCPRFEALPMYYLKELDVGPCILTIEACRYLGGGCMRGRECRFSHLQSEKDSAIRAEFDRCPIVLDGARPAFLMVRRARLEGLTAPEIFRRFPCSFPDQEVAQADDYVPVGDVTTLNPENLVDLEESNTHPNSTITLAHLSVPPAVIAP
jgi:hypothetical protein